MPTERTPLSTLKLRYADGSVQTFTPSASDDASDVTIILARTVEKRRFDVCPICLVAPATHREHLPPEALGGQRMLWTCEPCNTRLGSHLEEDLADWYDGTFRMNFSSDAIQGTRIFAKTRRMLTDQGPLILADDPKGATADALAAGMANGGVNVQFFAHAVNRSRLGLVKSTYLTACLDMGGPPAGVVADQVRCELITARDAPSREAVPRSELALGLNVSRSHDGQRGIDAPAAIAFSHSEHGPCWGALLVGSIFVEFPRGFPVAGINEPT